MYTRCVVAYLVFVVYGSLVPLEYEAIAWADAIDRFVHIPYLSLALGHRADLVANLLLFIPLTFCAMGATDRCQAGTAWTRGVCIAAAGVALSCGIEFTQIFFPARTVSLNDIIAESSGGLAGVVLYMRFGRVAGIHLLKAWQRHVGQAQALRLLLGYTIVLVLYQLLPLDLTLSLTELYRKYKEHRITLIPFTDVSWTHMNSSAIKILFMVPVGYMAGVWNRRRPGATWVAASFGLLAAGGIEFLQLFVYRRYCSMTDVVLGVVGAIAGGYLSTRFGPAATKPLPPSDWWQRWARPAAVTAACVWAVYLLGQAWKPFDPAPIEGTLWQHIWSQVQIPFYHQYYVSEFEAITQLLRNFLALFMFGILFRAAVPRELPVVVGTVISVVVAMLPESGQFLLEGRFADITIMGAHVAGAWCGYRMQPRLSDIFVYGRQVAGHVDQDSTGDGQ